MREEEQAKTATINCEHHWVSEHLPNFPIWLVRCSMCQQYDTEKMLEEYLDLVNRARIEECI